MNEEALSAVERAKANGDLLESTAKHVTEWLSSAAYAEFHEEIGALVGSGSWGELNDAFFRQIEFGTGGMRGPMGLGCARINNRTIGQATEALATYIETFGAKAKEAGVVVCHEVRKNSRTYAEGIVRILAAHNIRVFLFDGFRSTPELSFAVRALGAQAGIMISASHNPSSDNGYKVYWSKGEQVVAPHDRAIMERVPHVGDIPGISLEEARRRGMLNDIGEEIDTAYIDAVLQCSLQKEYRDLSVAYTPLHGSGQTSTLLALRADGFVVQDVREQMEPDGNFPTVNGGKPNPEAREAFSLAIAMARGARADVVFANDPDADRLGVAVRDREGGYTFLTGNQVGVLILFYLLSRRKAVGALQSTDVVVKTVVTTDLVEEMCRDYGVRCVGDLLVGFKYIADVMKMLKFDETFLMGVEESLGYLLGTYAYDKDAAGAAIVVAEAMAEWKANGVHVLEQLDRLYDRYGYYVERLENTYFKGAKGQEIMATMMDSLRNTPPTKLDGTPVIRMIDRKSGEILDPATRAVIGHTDAPRGNILIFELSRDGRTKVTVRPSGTEPKVKYYIACKGTRNEREECDVRAEAIGKAFIALAESFAKGA